MSCRTYVFRLFFCIFSCSIFVSARWIQRSVEDCTALTGPWCSGFYEAAAFLPSHHPTNPNSYEEDELRVFHSLIPLSIITFFGAKIVIYWDLLHYASIMLLVLFVLKSGPPQTMLPQSKSKFAQTWFMAMVVTLMMVTCKSQLSHQADCMLTVWRMRFLLLITDECRDALRSQDQKDFFNFVFCPPFC